MATPTFYVDGSETYLELHAMRVPVGDYLPEWTDERYEAEVQAVTRTFERQHNIELFHLGRSGRHICIADTPRNRRRYASLQKAAVDAARAMWARMRTPKAPEWPAVAPTSMDDPPVVVVFRTWRTKDAGVVALMPEINAGSGYCACYAHIGQHGAADYRGVIRQTRPATPAEYGLLRELTSAPYHYNFTIRTRRRKAAK